MLPNLLNSHSSSVSYSSYQSRFESQSYQKLDQQPISTQQAEKTESARDATSKADNFDVDALVKQIWSFASARIAKAEADGASEAELDSMWKAAKQGVTQGFSEAKDVLDGLGELDDPLEMKIDSAFGQIMDKLDERSLEPMDNIQTSVPVPTTKPTSPDRAISLYQYERQTFSLDLTTAQGDKIQIRSVAEESSTADDLRFGRLSSTQWSHSETSGFSLVIKGDLNEQEAADLDALLANVNELAEEFYNGDYETALEKAQALSIDGTTLKSMDLSMQETQQKGASVYAEMAGQPSALPKGLEPLKQYAQKLMDAQEKWQAQFNSAKDFLTSLENHPRNNGALSRAAHSLMW